MIEYQLIRNVFYPEDVGKVISAVEDSDELEMGELCHVIIKGTNTKVGYIGNETLELVDPNKKDLKQYHNLLKKIFKSV